ncbi:MAG: hypothetical protein HLUCCA01_10705 [Bacteroidetes bacterium HLUCCA01]|nr:MAG: hypothetical protein HLUCCA01_10705 [Bacteroidetes bacterium HLUCCA01]
MKYSLFRNRSALLWTGLLLCFSGCIEGPELVEDSPFTPFSGDFAVVFYHQYHPSYAASQNMSQQEYEELLVTVYGEKRRILLYGNVQQNANFIIEIPTRAIERPSECRKDTEGLLVYLDSDQFQVFDSNRSELFTSFVIPESYNGRGEPQRCSIVGIPAILPRNRR